MCNPVPSLVLTWPGKFYVCVSEAALHPEEDPMLVD